MKAKREKYLKKISKTPEKDNLSENPSETDELINKLSTRAEEMTDSDKTLALEAADTLKNISTNFLYSLRYKKVCQIHTSKYSQISQYL